MNGQEELIAAARSAAERLDVQSLSLAAFCKETGISHRQIYERFEGWPALCSAAGIEPCGQKRIISDDEIFAALRDIMLRTGGVPTRQRFEGESSYGHSILRGRFGSWAGTLAAFRRWATANAPDFPLMDALDARLAPPRGVAQEAASTPVPVWPSSGGRASGETLGFRALVFAPVNESGVVVLFGMVAAELGYRIETVAPGFPDCTARRHVGGGRWEPVRVEFEYRSRSFRDHGHDPAGCDVVVCWEHDWPECPVEVLSLREAIAALPAR